MDEIVVKRPLDMAETPQPLPDSLIPGLPENIEAIRDAWRRVDIDIRRRVVEAFTPSDETLIERDAVGALVEVFFAPTGAIRCCPWGLAMLEYNRRCAVRTITFGEPTARLAPYTDAIAECMGMDRTMYGLGIGSFINKYTSYLEHGHPITELIPLED